MTIRKRVAPMWFAPNTPIYEDALFHYGDKERAINQAGKENVRLVWVIVPKDYFIGTWQFANLFEGHIYDTEDEAMKAGGWA